MRLFDRSNKGGDGDGDKGGTGGGGNDDGKGGRSQPAKLDPWAKSGNMGDGDGDKGDDKGGGTGGGGGDGGNRNTSDADALRSFMRQHGLSDGLDRAKLKAAMDADDVDGVAAYMEQAVEQAVRVSLIGASKMTERLVAQAVEKAVGQAVSATGHERAVSDMHEALAFTKDPSIAPMAKQVLEGFLNQGQDRRTAIENVGKYFKQVAQDAGKALGLQMAPAGGQRPGQGRFATRTDDNNDNRGSDDSNGDIDWKSVLTFGDSAGNE